MPSAHITEPPPPLSSAVDFVVILYIVCNIKIFSALLLYVDRVLQVLHLFRLRRRSVIYSLCQFHHERIVCIFNSTLKSMLILKIPVEPQPSTSYVITELQPVRPSTSYVDNEPQPSASRGQSILGSNCTLQELDSVGMNSDMLSERNFGELNNIFRRFQIS